jgi:hypothetical protein
MTELLPVQENQNIIGMPRYNLFLIMTTELPDITIPCTKSLVQMEVQQAQRITHKQQRNIIGGI